MKKKRKETEEELDLKELMKTPKGKAVVFFGAYLVFFIIIAVVARVGARRPTVKDYETGNEYQFSFANVEKNNYKFNYKIKIDDNYLTYSGVRYNTQEKVTCTNLEEFYKEGENYFKNTGGVWLKANDPYMYKEFYDVDIVESLIEASSYISKTTFENGKTIYNFKTSSAVISKLINSSDLDIEEIPNEISISTDEDGYVNEVKFTLDSYCKAKSLCVNNMSITLNYELYGEIEKITSPLE